MFLFVLNIRTEISSLLILAILPDLTVCDVALAPQISCYIEAANLNISWFWSQTDYKLQTKLQTKLTSRSRFTAPANFRISKIISFVRKK